MTQTIATPIAPSTGWPVNIGGKALKNTLDVVQEHVYGGANIVKRHHRQEHDFGVRRCGEPPSVEIRYGCQIRAWSCMDAKILVASYNTVYAS